MANFLSFNPVKKTFQAAIFGAGFLFSSCNPILGVLTANWKNQLAYLETDDYDLRIKQNLYMGCPKPISSLSEHQISFENVSLPEAIRLLSDSPDRIEFVNLDRSKQAFRIDLEYAAKKDRSLQSDKDTVLNLLGKTTGYSVSKNRISKKVYSLKVSDNDKLKSSAYKEPGFVTAENKIVDFNKLKYSAQKKSSISVNDSSVVFTNCSLKTICRQLERNMPVYIDYDLDDTHLYSMVVPTISSTGLRGYFNLRGIDLIENEEEILITKITFKDDLRK
ncbi:MAG TPA: hypothetical protein VGD22_08920 [Sphingobacteriaceae bacterium]